MRIRAPAPQLIRVFDGPLECGAMTSQPSDRPTLTSLTITSLPYVTLLGCAGIVANIALSFEEPYREMLLIATLLLAAAPVGLFLHLAFTDELEPSDKRKWLRGLMSRRAPELFGAYFSSASRRRATSWLRRRAHGPDAGQR